jgi:hypothetical protein
MYVANPVYEFDLRELRLSLGDAYDSAGRLEEARATLSAAYADSVAHDGARTQRLHDMRERWGRFLLDHSRSNSADLRQAQAEFDVVIANPSSRFHDPDVLAHSDLARLAVVRNDGAGALRESRQALAMLDRVQLTDTRSSQRVWLAHSQVLLYNGNAAEAADWAAKAYRASMRTDDPGSPVVAAAKAALANARAGRQPKPS